MQSSLLEYLGYDNVLVGFNISWILTALQRAVYTTSVLNIGLEPTHHRWSRQLTLKAKRFTDLLVPNLCDCYDFCWPAILYEDSLEFSVNGFNTFSDTYYIEAVWQMIRDRVANDRTDVGVHMIKRFYKFGCGAGLVHRNLFFLKQSKISCCVRARVSKCKPAPPNSRK